MERRITKKIETHGQSFKNAIKDWFTENSHNVIAEDGESITGKFLAFVYDFENLHLEKEDFQKRKRVKNTVPEFERCTARRANGERCTRRKKEGCQFCGTHEKGTPHGVVSGGAADVNPTKKVEVWVAEINGINYYIDDEKNVYLPEDIITNKPVPRLIGKWDKHPNGELFIPDL